MPLFTVRDDYRPGTIGNVCMLCKASPRVASDGTRERIIDPNVHIDFEGFLCICEACVVEMGRLVGMVPKGEIGEARVAVARANAERDQARAEADDLHAAVDALSRAGYTPAEPFVCDVDGCDRTFGTEHGLNVHQSKAHPSETRSIR